MSRIPKGEIMEEIKENVYFSPELMAEGADDAIFATRYISSKKLMRPFIYHNECGALRVRHFEYYKLGEL